MAPPDAESLDPLLESENEPVVVIGSVSPKPHIYPQVIATFVVCLAPLSMGFGLGFSSPTIDQLQDKGLLENDKQVSWYGSLVTIGAIVGGPLAGVLIEKLGRKTTIMLANFPYSLGWVLITCANSYIMLFCGRILTGMAMGMSSLAAPVYLAEITTKELRGTLGAGFQLFVALGILGVYALGIPLNYQWLSNACGCIPALMVLLMLALPETPRWLFSKGIRTSGLASIRWLRGPEYDVEEESLEIEANIQVQRGQRVSLREFCQTKSLMKPLFISLGLMLFQQGTGVNCIIFYTSSIFANAGYSKNAHIPTVIIGAVQVVFTLVSCLLMDIAGRRVLLIIGSVFMTISHVALGVFYYYHDSNIEIEELSSFVKWIMNILPLASLILFIVAFSIGWGGIPWLVMSEIFPVHVRGIASSIATLTNWTLAYIVTYQFNNMLITFHHYGTFWFFGGFCFLSIFYVAFFLPETKGKSLEEIQEHFEEH